MANSNVRDRYVSDGAGVVPQPRLLIMLYDRLVLDLEQAGAALDGGHIAVVNDKLCHAQAILLELHAALDQQLWAGAANLGDLYLWFNNELIQANINKDGQRVRSCHRMIRELQVTWHRAYEQILAEQSSAKPATELSNSTATTNTVQ